VKATLHASQGGEVDAVYVIEANEVDFTIIVDKVFKTMNRLGGEMFKRDRGCVGIKFIQVIYIIVGLFCIAENVCSTELYKKATLFSIKLSTAEKMAVDNFLYDIDEDDSLYIYVENESRMNIYKPDGSLGSPISLVYPAKNYTYLHVSNGCFFFCPKKDDTILDIYEVKSKKWYRAKKFVMLRDFVDGCAYDLWTGELVWCASDRGKVEGYYGVKQKYEMIDGVNWSCLESKSGIRTPEIDDGYIFGTVAAIDLRGNLYLVYRKIEKTTDENGLEKTTLGDSRIVRYDEELKYQYEWDDKVFKVRRNDSAVFSIEMNDLIFRIFKWSEQH